MASSSSLIPSICSGYLQMKILSEEDPPSPSKGEAENTEVIEDFQTCFFVLDKGNLICYETETFPGSGIGAEDGDSIDLKGYFLELKLPKRFVLTKGQDNELSYIELEDSNSESFQKWTIALNDHLSYVNKVDPEASIISSPTSPETSLVSSVLNSSADSEASVINSVTDNSSTSTDLTSRTSTIETSNTAPMSSGSFVRIPEAFTSGNFRQSFEIHRPRAMSEFGGIIPETILECDDENEDPERCYGYVEKETKAGSQEFERLFFVLEDCELFMYRGEDGELPGEGLKPPLLIIDLDGWSLALPTKTSILLTPPVTEQGQADQISFDVMNTREYNKWASALNEHMQILNIIKEVLPTLNEEETDHQGGDEKSASARADSNDPLNLSSLSSLPTNIPPPSTVSARAAAESKEEYRDKRGILMSVESSISSPPKPIQPPQQSLSRQSSSISVPIASTSAPSAPISVTNTIPPVKEPIINTNPIASTNNTVAAATTITSASSSPRMTNNGSTTITTAATGGRGVTSKHRYPDETIEILRNQLIKEGKTPLEYIPLEELKEEMGVMFAKAGQGIDYDEGRLEYLMKCMDLNPEYKLEKDKETAVWRSEIESYAKECLQIMRGFIPPHIFNATQQTLVSNDGLPIDLAKRILTKKCLWLIRVSTTDLSKMHIAELQGRFNHEAQGLDIVELAAIFANVPEKFMNDDAKGSKEKWRLGLEEALKSFYTQMQKNVLPKLKLRNPAYKNLSPIFSTDEAYHSMHVTSSQGAFTARASFRLLNKRQEASRRSLVKAANSSSNNLTNNTTTTTALPPPPDLRKVKPTMTKNITPLPDF